MHFREQLTKRQTSIESVLCVGLDPLEEKIPASVLPGEATAKRVEQWMTDIVDATAPHTSLYKLQSASYEAIDGGMEVAFAILAYIRAHHPDIPVIIDAKRGDIGRSQEQYRKALLDNGGFDGMTYAPYMGKDCMEFLFNAEDAGKSLIGLCHTSNSSSREVQDVIFSDGVPYWEKMAEWVFAWGKDVGVGENTGLVLAAAYDKDGEIYSDHLHRTREIVGNDAWFLIPGVGTQGGYVEETVRNAFSGWGSIAINSSSGIVMASDGTDYAEVAAREAALLKRKMAHVILSK